MSQSVISERSGRVRERLIAALIPDTVGLAEAVPPVALPLLPALRRVELAGLALLVATARMDRSGRVGERLLLRALGWQPGQRLDMDTMHGMIVIAAAPDGIYVVDARCVVKLPAALRHLCGIEPGPPPGAGGRGGRAGAGRTSRRGRGPAVGRPLHRSVGCGS